MQLSAIYPRELGLAILKVLWWLQYGTSSASMATFADEFVDQLPSPDFSLQQAREDSERVSFDDRDVGWADMQAELPERMPISSKKVLLKKKKMMKESVAGPIAVEDNTDSELEADDLEPHHHARSQEFGCLAGILCSSCPAGLTNYLFC